MNQARVEVSGGSEEDYYDDSAPSGYAKKRRSGSFTACTAPNPDFLFSYGAKFSPYRPIISSEMLPYGRRAFLQAHEFRLSAN